MLRVIIWSSEGEAKNIQASTFSQLQDVTIEEHTEVSLLEALADSSQFSQHKDTPVLLIRSSLLLNEDSARALVDEAQTFNGSIGSIVLESGEHRLTIPEVESSTIIQNITPAQSWNTAAIITKELLLAGRAKSDSMTMTFIKIIVDSLADQLDQDWNTLTLQQPSEEFQQCESRLSSRESIELLQYTVGKIPIEELFPNHSWEKYPEESAAACYHSLAARFISLGGIEQAKECLNNSDRLEDSPRSLALKGLIALKEGETLSAVANMVSSLQEYEKRKIADSTHYLSFKPQNFETINMSLQNGLSALNKRDNDKAAQYFTDAVFHFDHFYTECGLQGFDS